MDMTSGKGTESAYARHIKNYIAFWTEDQARRCQDDPLWTIMSAHPITVTKAAVFLEYESTRAKSTHDGQPIPGQRVGAESIKQCISALESYRYNHCSSDPEYVNEPQSQIPLRSDVRITTYEINAQAKEPQRLAEAQVLKAFGATSDTYSPDELLRISTSFLDQDHTTKLQTHLATRDRSMILISTATAYRGDNIRRLLLSDLSARDVPMVDIGLGVKVMALVLTSDQGKTNTTGRIEDQAAFRHRLPELCPIGGLGFYLFSKFHVTGEAVPDFAPIFDDPQGGMLGLRSWYQIHLFPGSKDGMTEMTYERPPQELLSLIFPWVEAENSALQDRQASHGRNGSDVALQKLLDLLARLRCIILQDAAVLFTKFPSYSLFRYAPFNTPLFRTFAATSPAIIDEAEQRARHQLSSIPDNLAQSLHGIITSNNLQQEQARREMQNHGQHITAKLQDMETFFQACATSMGPRAFRRQANALLSGQTQRETSTSTSCPSRASHLSQPIDQPTPATPVTTSALPSSDTASDVIIASPSTSTTISLAGHIYSPTVFRLSAESTQRGKQLTAIETLEKKYGAERLRRHSFEWKRASSRKQDDEWLPLYSYWKPAGKDSTPSIAEVWTEWTVGMDGQLSVRDLNAGWDARWRRDNGALKTEAGRRKKIIALIEKLSAKPNWNDTIALRFLSEKYRIPSPSISYLRTTRAFTDYLQSTKHNGMEEILEAANSYI
ncbi:hypothetical protein FPV67DRAFT_54136 [Lyophyllum atratum]|nr:hypothetical protein FPV67DRAFT_54136 [Lyophyllum atratum]